jgi:Ferritin-like
MEARSPMTTGSPRIKGRDPSLKPTDKSALYAIAQAAIDVELFTIPLYMSTLYSIQGMHEINSKGMSFYKGRLWPGLATTAQPRTPNEEAFNIIFSVFVEEMLHLQLAADIASAIGAPLTFTSSALQTPDNGWTCYGPNNTMIPRILDLRDTKPYANVKVNLAPLNRDQIELLLAIEEPFDIAMENIRPDKLPKYFPEVPFAGWQPKHTEKDLPPFGSIGWMYKCYADYTDITYSDGTTLWDYVFNSIGPQRDLFNVADKQHHASHPLAEYPQFDASIPRHTDAAQAHLLVKDMMCAITDQGEGSLISREAKKQASEKLQETLRRYAPSKPALEADYPSYDSSGNKKGLSDDAGARYQPGRVLGSELDHYERFKHLRDDLLPHVVTWDKWRPGVKDKWTAKDLCPGVDQASSNIPKPDTVAQALNRLAADPKNHQLFSEVCVGSIKGITTVLDQYWQYYGIPFPNPSMWGSGDRVAICWAIFGMAPDLSQGINPPAHGLQHSCQGLDFKAPGGNCAAVNVFHTCKGSNACQAQGGCGFVHALGGCGLVQSHRGATAALVENPPTSPEATYNAPGDNSCKSAGGCAVPISASQLFPSAGLMQPVNFPPSGLPVNVGQPFQFNVGDSVYDTAWKTYVIVMNARGQNPGTKPRSNDLRLAFPPST